MIRLKTSEESGLRIAHSAHAAGTLLRMRNGIVY